MLDEPRALIEQLHASPWRAVLAITGGGSAAISQLASVPGASNTLLEATVPYAEVALAEYLGFTPESACSERTARALAMAAFQRGRKLAGDHEALIGLGATASLASTRPKRGEHRVHIAWQTLNEMGVYSVILTKGARERAAEEALTAEFILHALCTACDLAPFPPATLPSDVLTTCTAKHPEWLPLLAGHSLPCPAAPPALLFPGAFNPPHAGHHEMAAYAAARYGRPVTYELSVTNVDKPPLDYLEIESRLAQLANRNVWLTCAPTFVEKARLAPGATFIVGADTIQRIADPRYYHDSEAARDAAIVELTVLGTCFCVFGRVVGEHFTAAEKLNLPPQLAALCDMVPETDFRVDLSSTSLRDQKRERR
jgi:nicotinic acid mononucleotide adenylyltransferase/nicotinamide mononucleotide (NMN) deamidase PncC